MVNSDYILEISVITDWSIIGNDDQRRIFGNNGDHWLAKGNGGGQQINGHWEEHQ